MKGLEILDDAYNVQRQIYEQLEDGKQKRGLIKELVHNRIASKEMRELFNSVVVIEPKEASNN